ncbi:MAG TPA: aromatic amino acid hydroxylase [Polyangiaceae bacterium]|nr:aromatic amino acid hydroxylase [Polyangiaceae bacterium]
MSVSAPKVAPLQPAEAVPRHLRRFVVEQDYSQYNVVDQAVWRFVLKHTHARLISTAHPAYHSGLSATGISLERIPSIEEMNERLARFGWGAVCVDGFLPPRAFQSFQAERILPIAGEIRTREHLVYTPAPDIIHEASGHAPILTDPVFSRYVQRMGWLGRQAFTLPSEERVYQAIYNLSEIKENPASDAAKVQQAEAELALAVKHAGEPSEAARLSRLYWWTAEYGLIGRPEAYQIYGAGLLSSLWESYSCHAASVSKRVLDETCMDVAYDITRTQPVLFVVPSFEALHGLLDRVERGMAAQVGGRYALEHATRSAEPATFEFESGARLYGVLNGFAGERTKRLQFGGSVRAVWRMGEPSIALGADLCIVAGRTLDGQGLAEWMVQGSHGASGRVQVQFAEGTSLVGRLAAQAVTGPDGAARCLQLEDVELRSPDSPPRFFREYTLLALGEFVTARAGADSDLERELSLYERTLSTEQKTPSPWRVPRVRVFAEPELRLQALYSRWERVRESAFAEQSMEIRALYAALAEYPNEWLLRLQLLQGATRMPELADLQRTLRGELERLELLFEGREPIETGLREVGHAA